MTTYTRSKLLLLAVFSVLGLVLSGQTAHAALTATIAYAQTSSTTATLTATVSGGAAGDHYTYTFSQVGTTPGAATGFAPVTNVTTTSATNTITVNTPSAAKNDYTFKVVVDDTTAATSANNTTTATVQQPNVFLSTRSSAVGIQTGHNSAPFTVILADQFADPLTFSDTRTVSWSIVGSPAGASVSPASGMISTASPTTTTTFTATAASPYTLAVTATGFGVLDFPVTAYAPPTASLAAAVNANGITGTLTTTASTSIPLPGNTLTYAYAKTSGPAATITGSGATATDTYSALGNYVFQATVTDSLGQTTTAMSNTVTVSQVFTSIAVTPASPTVNITDTDQFTAVADDQFGAPLTMQPASFTWSVTAPVSGAGTVDGTGLFTAPDFITGSATQTDTIQATSGAVMGTGHVTVDDVAPTVMTAASANPSPVTGKTTVLSTLGSFVGGESHLTYTWSVMSGPSGATFSDNGTNTAQTCTATFTQAGTYVFKVTITDPSGNTATSLVTVTVDQTFTSIDVTPASPTLSVGGTQQFTASALDQFGIALTTQPAFTWTVTAGTGTITSAGGLFTAPSRLAGNSENDTVQAKSGSIFGTATATVHDSAPTITTAAKANGTAATYTAAGTSVALTVVAAYAGGESNLTYTWSYTGPVGAPAVVFSGAVNGTNAAKNITATFGEAGTYVFTVTVADPSGNTVPSSVTVIVDQTLTSISVTPASQTINVGGTQQFTATAFDQFGAALTTQPASFTWTVTAGHGTITSPGGLFTAPSTLSGNSEVDIVKATGGTVAGTTTITIGNVAPTVVNAAAANGTPGTYTATGTAVTLTVLGAYAGGESNLTYTWTATGPGAVVVGTPAIGVNPAVVNGTNAAKNILATFTQAGTYTLTATIAAPAVSSVTSSVTVIVDQTFTSISVTPAAPTVAITGTDQFTATALDQFGNPIPGQTFSWSVISGTGTVGATTGLFTAPSTLAASATSETDTVQAASGAITKTATVTVTDAAPTVAAAAAATPNPATGKTTALSVLGAYAGGETNLTYTWTVAGPANVTFAGSATPNVSTTSNAAKDITATFGKIGTYVFTVTISDPSGKTVSSAVTVAVEATLAKIVVVGPALVPPATILKVNVGGLVDFSATADDQFGNLLSVQPVFTWSLTAGTGKVNAATGVFSAPDTLASGTSPETDTVQAVSGTVAGNDSVDVYETPPTVKNAAEANGVPGSYTATGTSVALTVFGAYAGGEPNLTYDWTVTYTGTETPVTFSGATNPSNAAQNITATFKNAGTYMFTCTITDPTGSSVTSSVLVTVSQELTTIAVSPQATTLPFGGTRQFIAAGKDQFGNLLASQPAFMWTATGGTINAATGAYTAPNVPGTFSVTVQGPMGGPQAAAAVTVTGLVGLGVSQNPLTVGDPTFTSFTISGSPLSMFQPVGKTDFFDQTVVLEYQGQFDPNQLGTVFDSTSDDVVVDSPTLLTVNNVPVQTTTVTGAIPYAGQYLVALVDQPTITIATLSAADIVGTQTLEVEPLPASTDISRGGGTPAEASPSFSEGLHMVSAPFDYTTGIFTGAAITEVFKLLDFSTTTPTYNAVGPNLRFAVWQPGMSNYAITSAGGSTSADTLAIGQGYWVRFPNPTQVTGSSLAEPGLIMRGTPADLSAGYVASTGQYKIALTPGWNMIGDPFTNSVQLSNFQVAPAGGTPISLMDADTQSIVSDTLYTYNLLDSAGYDSITPGGTGLGGELVPYVGYWILAYQPCTLYVSSN